MDNPFVFNGYASAEYFCDREKELVDLQKVAKIPLKHLQKVA